jgi:hypothetical protein
VHGLTSKSDFTEQEWEVLREGPPIARPACGDRLEQGTFRESRALATSFAEARQQHDESEVLDSLVAEKPKSQAKRHGSSQELEQQGWSAFARPSGCWSKKASADEVEAYRRFTLAAV